MIPVAALFAAGCLFQDPLEELDPAILESGGFDTLAPSESFLVARGHILESFGAFACANCTGAEGRLSPYLHATPGSPLYVPRLVIVNYHVLFPGTLADPWITAGTQARHDKLGFTGLPQATLNGSNAPYGIREKNVAYAQGEYDSLIARLRRVDSLTYLDLSVDTSWYDSVAHRITVRFTASNRGAAARGRLVLQVLAVKNRSFPYYYPNHLWEVVVAEATEHDSSGAPMTLAGMAGLRSKSWIATLEIPLESERTPAPVPLENPSNYAVVVVARNGQGVVQNVAARNYAPEP
jgi:hypothetical protein